VAAWFSEAAAPDRRTVIRNGTNGMLLEKAPARRCINAMLRDNRILKGATEKSWSQGKSALVGVIVVSFAIHGCSIKADYGEALQASDRFHKMVAQGDFGAIYDSSSKGLQNGITRGQWIGLLSRIRRKLGKCLEAPMNVTSY
jgi:hypothetical protein